MRIGCDIDGVLYPWTTAVNQACIARFGIEDPGEHQYWDFLKEKVTKDQWAWIWSSDGADEVFGRMDLIFPGCQAAINELASKHEVHFVTHRNPYRISGITGTWLKRYFRNYRGVHVLDNSTRKSEILGWDAFIDDKPEIVHEMLGAKVPYVFCPVRDYNAHLLEEESDVLTMFTDWEEVLWRLA